LSSREIPNADIIRMATVNAYTMLRSVPADSLQRTRPFGEIKPGYRADLLLLTGNPLDNIMNYFKISAMFINGNYLNEYDRALLIKNQ